jgi:aminobenzoyl-glutamate transport protein
MAGSVEAKGQRMKDSKFLRTVETVGNKMVQPMTLFGILCLVVLVLSWIGSAMGWSATGEMYNTATGAVEETTVTVYNLMSRDGIDYILRNFVNNVITYSPLGVMLVMFLGIGLADGSGLIAIALRKVVKSTPEKLLVPVLLTISVCGNLASSACSLVLVPIAGVVFLNYGKHPIAGMMGCLAAITAGYSANLIPTDVDATLSAITTEAAHLIDPNYTVSPMSNYYFMVAGTFILGLLCWFITEKFIEPMLGEYDPSEAGSDLSEFKLVDITEKESKAFRTSMLVLLGLLVLLVVLCIPQDSVFRNAETGSLVTKSLLMDALIPILSILFFVPSLVYGFMTGIFKSERDVVNQIYKSFGSLASVFAVAITAGQFMKWFSVSKLGNLLAFAGAELLGKANLPFVVVLVIFALFTALLNVFMNSATAKWYIFAPVFVPMLMQLGISPELTQLFYRVGDSCTNAVTPLNSFLPVTIMFLQRYKKDAGIGTYVATLLPYSVGFLIVWVLVAAIWFLLGIPIGPGATLFY